MTFDVFKLRERVVEEYGDYVKSIVNILDPRIETFVEDRLAEGEQWPEAVLQLNPAYDAAELDRARKRLRDHAFDPVRCEG